MPEIEVRPAALSDVPELMIINHNYTSDYVWQMELRLEEGKAEVNFHQTRLPRSVKVEYPRSVQDLFERWQQKSNILVATLNQKPVGYIRLEPGLAPNTAWVPDLAVAELHRRKGIATGLLVAAQDWALQKNNRVLIIEMQSKNYAAIQLVKKLGYEFCGYNDHYYGYQDIVLFFARYIR